MWKYQDINLTLCHSPLAVLILPIKTNQAECNQVWQHLCCGSFCFAVHQVHSHLRSGFHNMFWQVISFWFSCLWEMLWETLETTKCVIQPHLTQWESSWEDESVLVTVWTILKISLPLWLIINVPFFLSHNTTLTGCHVTLKKTTWQTGLPAL